jgi:hypothetical protein
MGAVLLPVIGVVVFFTNDRVSFWDLLPFLGIGVFLAGVWIGLYVGGAWSAVQVSRVLARAT